MTLFLNSFEIISAFYFARNHVWNRNRTISAILHTFENIRELFPATEIISGEFPRAEIKYSRRTSSMKAGIILFRMQPRH